MKDCIFSVVIPCYNNADVLSIVLKQWASVDFDDYEIIIVDDGSPSNSGIKEIVESLGHTYLYNDTGDVFSAGSARNLGIINSKGRRILFSDSDMIPQPNYIKEHMLKMSDNNVTVGMRYHIHGNKEYVVSLINNSEISFTGNQLYCGGNKVSCAYDERMGNVFTNIDNGTYDPWNCAYSCNLSINREQLLGIGGFDESYDGNWGAEEIEMVYRLWKKYRISARVCNSIGYHIPHTSRYANSINLDKLTDTIRRGECMNPTTPKSWR